MKTKESVIEQLKFCILNCYKWGQNQPIENTIKVLYKYNNSAYKNIFTEDFDAFIKSLVVDLINSDTLKKIDNNLLCKKGINYDTTLRVIIARLCGELGVYIENTNSDFPSVGCKDKNESILSYGQIVDLGLTAYSYGLINDKMS